MATTGPDGVTSGRSTGVYNIKDDKNKKGNNNQQVQNSGNSVPVVNAVQTEGKSNNKKTAAEKIFRCF